ncbi:MAG: 4'-phosphopantetheinyl transferase superfamily protein [Xanthobacteraceae bacterium]
MAQAPSTNPVLQGALAGLAPGIAVGHRLIAPGDDVALLDEEAQSITSAVVAVRRASGTARLVARDLLKRLGYPACSVPKTKSGAPAWPAGVIGSLAHDEQIAVAAVALRRDFEALGVDVEPAEPLPPDVLDLVATARERAGLGNDPLRGRLLFAAKEAVYKALYPRHRVFLEYHDIEVDLAAGNAVVRKERGLELRFCIAKHVVILAFSRAAATVAA